MTDKSRRNFLTRSSAVMFSAMLLPKSAMAEQAEGQKSVRILVVNPNSSQEFTDVIMREVRRVGSPGAEFVEATAFFGPRYIGTRTTAAIAGHAAVDALARILSDDPNFDAAILAGFGAQGVPAMRELAPFPVLDMLEASVSAAMLLGNRFSVLTGGERWVPMLKERLDNLGLSSRTASVRSIPLTGAEIVKDQDRALTLLADLSEACVREDGADCVILGGAAVAGIPRKIADRVSVPLIDNVAMTVASAEMLARVVAVPKRSDDFPSIDSTGLSDELGTVIK
jgi:Asp/Glu/hydantoin racemase